MKKEKDNNERIRKIAEAKGDVDISIRSRGNWEYDMSTKGGKFPVLRGISMLLITMLADKRISLDDVDAVYEIVYYTFKKGEKKWIS